MATTVRGTSTRAAQAERTRQQILETAERLFAEQGYDATSLQMIADEMGLTKAAVYYHFPAKVDIRHAILMPKVEQLATLLDEAAAIRGRRARVEHLVNGFADFFVESRRYALTATDPSAKREKLDEEPLSMLRILRVPS
jgi:AcrR family transcriptional regulator